MKQIYLSETDLVINTMIDALEYENRRVIDTNDIYSYQEQSRKHFKQANLNVIFYGDRTTQEEFYKEIESYLARYDNKYVLLPWIEKEDLIKAFRGTVPFAVIKVIAKKDRESFLQKKSQETIESLNMIHDLVVSDYLDLVSDTVKVLETKLEQENKKLEKIKKYRNKQS